MRTLHPTPRTARARLLLMQRQRRRLNGLQWITQVSLAVATGLTTQNAVAQCVREAASAVALRARRPLVRAAIEAVVRPWSRRRSARVGAAPGP